MGQREAIAEKEEKFGILEAQNREIEETIPNVEELRREIAASTTQKERNDDQIRSMRDEEVAKRARIDALKAKIALQRDKISKLNSDTDHVMAKVRTQQMTSAEFKQSISDTQALKTTFAKVENDIRGTDEQIRMTEKQIQATVNDISNQSQTVNKLLVTLKLQNQQEVMKGGYSQGIHIQMGPDGLVNKGTIQLERDIQPIIEDMKAKWKTKIAKLNGERDQITQQVVQSDIKVRQLEEEIKRHTLDLTNFS